VGRLEEAVVVRQLQHLAIRRLGEFAAAITQVDAPQACHAVEDPIAVGIVEVHALRLHDDPRTLGVQELVVREGVEVVLAIEFLPGGSRAVGDVGR
jgi:hypothetical protein